LTNFSVFCKNLTNIYLGLIIKRNKLGEFYMELNERVKEIKGHPLYFITDFGNVYSMRGVGRSLGSYKLPVKLKLMDKDGYRVVILDGKNYRVHRLVAAAFIGKSDAEVNHKDGNRSNNYFENLEYCTHEYNMGHGADRRNALKIDLEEDVIDSIECFISASKYSLSEIADIFGVKFSDVKKVMKTLDKSY